MRLIICFLIGVGCLFYGGCVPSMHAITHPHSEITAPTFCLYEGWSTKKDAKPAPINSIRVNRVNKVNDEPIDWTKLKEYGQLRPSIDQVAWEIEYASDGKSKPPERRFSCITYGQVPPGYIEKITAQPLIPERLYSVAIKGMPRSSVIFVIRVDSMGHPTHAGHTGRS